MGYYIMQYHEPNKWKVGYYMKNGTFVEKGTVKTLEEAKTMCAKTKDCQALDPFIEEVREKMKKSERIKNYHEKVSKLGRKIMKHMMAWGVHPEVAIDGAKLAIEGYKIEQDMKKKKRKRKRLFSNPLW